MDMAISDALWFSIALFTTLSALVVTKIAKGLRSDPTSCTRPNPPVFSSFALLGLLPTLLLKEGPQTILNGLYKKLGSVFTVSLFGAKITFLIGPEVSAHFFQGLESEISHGNLLEFTVPMFGEETGFRVDSDTRSEHRRFVVDALKPLMLRKHVVPMLQEVEEYFAKWGEDGIVDIKHELDQLLMFITSRCLLGKEVREMMLDEFFTLFHEIEKGISLISILFPYIPIPAHRRRDRARIKAREMLSEIMRSRRGSNRVEDDILQRLMDAKYKDGRPTTEAEVTGLITGILFAAKHSSSAASTWTGACLLSHGDFLAAAVEEQKQIVSRHGGRIDYEVLLEMGFLHRCIKETLRLHSPTPALLRKAHKRFTVRTRQGEEYEIPAGRTVASPLVVSNVIPYVYKDPEVYDPDRFGPGRQEDKAGGKFSYTPFSAGRHICAGEAFAYMQMKAIWSHLLRNFELQMLSPFPTTDWTKFALEAKGKVMVSYKRRSLL